MADERTDPQFKLRFSEELRDRIAEAAKAANRSMNAEIVSRLEGSFSAPAREAAQIAGVTELLTGVVARVASDMRAEGRTPEDFANWMRGFPAFARFMPPNVTFLEPHTQREGPEDVN